MWFVRFNLLFLYVFMCVVYVCERVCAHTRVHMWRSELDTGPLPLLLFTFIINYF